jgi:hypothetical protein
MVQCLCSVAIQCEDEVRSYGEAAIEKQLPYMDFNIAQYEYDNVNVEIQWAITQECLQMFEVALDFRVDGLEQFGGIAGHHS